MRLNKAIRTVLPPIAGYLTFLLFDGLFEKLFPLEPYDEPSAPGIVFVFWKLGDLAMIALGFTFQYKVIVPKTNNSTKKVIIRAALFGIILGVILSFIDSFYRASIKDVLIEFVRFLVDYESFVMRNLALLTVFNFIENKKKVNSGLRSKIINEA
ncbi:hypothetical protein [Adhaeribacter pallidiroseus]|uniref:Uncharacterized protein n=1 Tax=Adhaeribacter pallidiroseus TaxID=2072847 RepID=A0A369QD12_9BACT|nr:hypothetical protein [Adhaeribacter pallidiroseus]RDC62791.1 hypothetical protein AHMF7616_01385 [Adhaeribacter pallidiroseus]